jgi:hypothetical protein
MKKLLTLLVLTGTLFAQANNIFTLNPSVSSAGMGNVGIANARCKKCISQSSVCRTKRITPRSFLCGVVTKPN